MNFNNSQCAKPVTARTCTGSGDRKPQLQDELEHRVPLLREEMFPMNPHLLPLLLMVFLKNNKMLVIWTSTAAKVQALSSLGQVQVTEL